MGEHRVLAGETLTSIARLYNFRNYKTILDAHNEMSDKDFKKYRRINNPNLLIEGQIIYFPTSTNKFTLLDVGNHGQYCVTVKNNQYLRLKIEDSFNEIANINRDISLFIGNKEIKDKNCQTSYDDGIFFKEISTKFPFSGTEIENSRLEIFTTSPFTGIRKDKPLKIDLKIGELDPIIDPIAKNICSETDSKQTKIAVQKILKNLGLYTGDLDGDLEKPESFRAISNFQLAENIKVEPEHFGKATQSTLTLLQINQGFNESINPIKISPHTKQPKIDLKIPLFQRLAENDPENKYNPISVGRGWKQNRDLGSFKTGYFGKLAANAVIDKFDSYIDREQAQIEPASSKAPPKTRVDFTTSLFTNKTLYVAPCDTAFGQPNIIKNESSEIIFLDVGRWKNQARDFGLVWGRHVYLCSYNKIKDSKIDTIKIKGDLFLEENAKRTEGLDLEFFKRFEHKISNGKISIQSVAYMNLGAEDEFDWENIHLILPDMHLISPEIASVWYKVLDKNEESHVFLKAERDFFDFVNDLIGKNNIKNTNAKDDFLSKLKITNIGDIYDLWVGMGTSKKIGEEKVLPLFVENPNEKVVLNESDPFWAFDYFLCEEIGYNQTQTLRAEQNHNHKTTRSFINEHIQAIQRLEFYHIHLETAFSVESSYSDNIKTAKTKLDQATSQAIKKQTQYSDSSDMFKVAGKFMHPISADKDVIKAQKDYDIALGRKELFEKARIYWHKNYDDLNKWMNAGNNLELLKHYKGKDGRFWEESWFCLNPAEAALRILEEKCGITYIYGNHDSYLAENKIVESARLNKRVSFHRPDKNNKKALFIEHGQRLEAFFKTYKYFAKVGINFPTNEDGNYSGFKATCGVFNSELNKVIFDSRILKSAVRFFNYHLADKIDLVAGGLHDQWVYRKEFAKYFLGEKANGKKPPRIYVIGHTHMPQLVHMKIAINNIDYPYEYI